MVCYLTMRVTHQPKCGVQVCGVFFSTIFCELSGVVILRMYVFGCVCACL